MLKTGTAFAVLNTEGQPAVMKESLNKYDSWFEILFFRRNYILWGTLFEPEALLELREDIMLVISSLSVDYRIIVPLVSLER